MKITRSRSVVYAGPILLGALCGCDDVGPKRRPPPPPPPAAEQSLGGSDTPPAADETVGDQPTRSADRPQPREGNGPVPEPEEETPLRLSAGVAVPQSLPTGTAMGFSVDYEFRDGDPPPSYEYVWVIRAANGGEPWAQAVQLTGRGTLQTFIPQWRPADGPFETFIAEVRPDGSRRPLSPAEPLAENGR